MANAIKFAAVLVTNYLESSYSDIIVSHDKSFKRIDLNKFYITTNSKYPLIVI